MKKHLSVSDNIYAVITGGSSGIGLEYAKILAGKKYNLVLVSNQEQKLEEVCDFLQKEYAINVHTLCIDLSLPESAKQVYEYCKEKALQIDILINNAGMFFISDAVDADINKTKTLLSLHTTTPTLLCQYFGQDMKARKHGYILNMSSMSAWMPYPKISLYATSKRYLKDFSRAFRTEMLKDNVSVSVACPGAVDTGLYNIAPKFQKIAVNFHIMMPPDKLAKKVIKALFKRKACIVPGTINKIAIPFFGLVPNSLVVFVEKKLKNVFAGS